MKIVPYCELSDDEKERLYAYLEPSRKNIHPHKTIYFLRVIDSVFHYKNLSLVAFNSKGEVKGFLPQWKKEKAVESVPWRDKGGPICESEEVRHLLRRETLKIAERVGCRGVLWRDFEEPEFEKISYYVNVDIELNRYDIEHYWKLLSVKTRGKIRQAEKNGLKFEVCEEVDRTQIERFYKNFEQNRHRLGVPAYPKRLFETYFRIFPKANIKMCDVIEKSGESLASLILLLSKKAAIDAYSASNLEGLKKKANDYMIFNVVRYCMERGITSFDFGADSPLQQSLLQYKLKWIGEKRIITSSYWGKVKEVDTNRKIYNVARRIIRRLPYTIYRPMSMILIK